MEMLQAFILAVIQGITEWLPVSSSGHMALLQHFFGIHEPMGFDLMLRLASLLVVLYVFRIDIVEIIQALLAWRPGVPFMRDAYRRWAVFIILGSIPIAIGGYVFESVATETFSGVIPVGIAFLVSGFLLSMTALVRARREMPTAMQSFIVGVFQALALIPGVSRTGATISSGILQGVSPENSARLSFLLFIPAILGSAAYQLPTTIVNADVAVLFVAVLTTAVVSYAAIELLLMAVRYNKLHHFAWYCYAVGFIVLFMV